jgi:preprotein translocase subunit SecD
MKFRFVRFNTYLLFLAIALSVGCKSPEQRKRDRTVAKLRLFLEGAQDGTDNYETVEISGVALLANRQPFLDEGNILQAAVLETRDGGFAMQVQFDRHGALVLDAISAQYRSRRMIVFSQISVDKAVTAHWLGAPLIGERILDGQILFTPNATRAEAEQIALGVNNLVKKAKRRSFVD